jgi:putative ABC transport system permease protein
VSDVAVDVEGTMQPMVYHAHSQFAGDRNWELTQVVSSSDSPEALISRVHSVLVKMDPQLVMYRPMPFNKAIGHGSASRRFMLQVLSAFAGIALLLAALGLFGVLSYTVKLRSREFGIRMALGAERGAIRRMVMRRGLTVSAVGVLCGLAGAAALSRVLATMVFQVDPLDPKVLGIAVLFMGAVAAIAAFVPAYRATAMEPRTVLVEE